MQSKPPLAGHQIKMIMRPGCRQGGTKRKRARHAQMAQQHAMVQIDQEIFATAAYPQHPMPLQMRGLAPQGPAQRFANTDLRDQGTGNVLRKAAPRDFDFG